MGVFDFEKSHRDDGRTIIIDHNCVWKRVPRVRLRPSDYKRHCGIVTGDGRGRAVDRTVDRLIIALYSRKTRPDTFVQVYSDGIYLFFSPGTDRRRHACLSRVICPPT